MQILLRKSKLKERLGITAAASPGTTDLMDWWTLDDAASPATWVASHTSPTYDLSKVGTVTSSTGQVSGSAAMGGSGNYLTGASVDNTFHQSDFSCGGWIKMTSLATGSILNKYGTTTATRHWALWYNVTNNLFEFRVPNTAGTEFIASSDATYSTTAEWKFIVGVREADTLKMYIDGVLQATTGDVTGIAENTGSTSLRIGRASNAYLNGEVDEAFLFLDALTAAEVTWLYNAGAGRTYADL